MSFTSRAIPVWVTASDQPRGLVDVGPVDFIGLPVEEEALFGRKGEPPHAEGGLLALGLLVLHREGCLQGVELRALGAPQVGGKHLQLLGEGFLFPRGGFPAGLCLGHRFPWYFTTEESRKGLFWAVRFSTSVCTSTSARSREAWGVVTQTPSQATRTGSVTSRLTSR